MLKRRKRQPRRSLWKVQRAKAIPPQGSLCPCGCGSLLFYMFNAVVKFSGVIDHLVAERIVRTISGGSPHADINLLGVCGSCHSKKTAIEKYLERGDLIRFRAEVNAIGFPMERVDAALRHFGLMR